MSSEPLSLFKPHFGEPQISSFFCNDEKITLTRNEKKIQTRRLIEYDFLFTILYRVENFVITLKTDIFFLSIY